jgi:hypothetical protein
MNVARVGEAPAQPGGWVPPAGAVPWTSKRPSRLDDVLGASEGAVELPLSTVLHPGLPISLHVFEDRYWEMFGRALDGERRFGWSLSSTAMRSAGPPSTTRSAAWPRSATSGATPTGRLDVVARDERCFRIEGVTQAAQYIANVATLGESAGERGRGADRPGRPPLQPAMSPPRGRSSVRARSGRSTCPMTGRSLLPGRGRPPGRPARQAEPAGHPVRVRALRTEGRSCGGSCPCSSSWASPVRLARHCPSR